MSEIDARFGTRTGKIYYHHPRNNYAHPRELMQPRHRADVLAMLDRIRERKPFNASGITTLRNQYENNRPVPAQVLQGLLTVDQWYRHYEA